MSPVICEEFLKYMDGFKPFLLVGLKNRAEYQVCHAAVGLVGDLARSLQSHIGPYAKDIMEVLFEDLAVSVVCWLLSNVIVVMQDPSLHRSVKTVIISTLGDIAIAIGAEFQVYLEAVLAVLQQAASLQVDKVQWCIL